MTSLQMINPPFRTDFNCNRWGGEGLTPEPLSQNQEQQDPFLQTKNHDGEKSAIPPQPLTHLARLMLCFHIHPAKKNRFLYFPQCGELVVNFLPFVYQDG